MTASQKLEIRASEIREKLNELSGAESLTDEQRSEIDALTTEYRDTESKRRAAIVAEDAEARKAAEESGEVLDAEMRERLELRGKSRLSRYFAAMFNGREVNGAEAELAEAEECPGMVPLCLLDATPEERKAMEERAVTPAPGTVGVTMHPTLPGVFLPMAAQALRVDMPRVGAGTQAYPVVSTDVTAAARDKGVAGPETAGAITVTTEHIKRVTGSFRLAVEDVQKLPTLEQSFRSNLASVLSDAVDGLIVNGVTAENNVVAAVPGFFGTAPVVTAATAEGTAGDFGKFIAKVLSQLDGNYARAMRDLSLVCAPEVVATMATAFLSGTAESALSYLQSLTMGVTATDRITPSSNVSPGMVVRHSIGGRVAVAPVWSGFQIITDPYSGASKGETVITAVLMQAGVKVLRGDVYKAVSFKTA
ncbi:MAG: hypothetical protein F4205_18140 [Gemmatimonadetes bacterium]|nr:hypothetical protein [Gemmatimonadota bacterium]